MHNLFFTIKTEKKFLPDILFCQIHNRYIRYLFLD